ncbi:hypothetical protein H0G86_011459, partial [Trichoderma simmonsii]
TLRGTYYICQSCTREFQRMGPIFDTTYNPDGKNAEDSDTSDEFSDTSSDDE